MRRRQGCLHKSQGEQPRGEIGIVGYPSWATSTLGSWPAHPLLLGPCCRKRRKRTNRPWPGEDAKVNRRIFVRASEAPARATVPKRTQRASAIQARAARAPDIAGAHLLEQLLRLLLQCLFRRVVLLPQGITSIRPPLLAPLRQHRRPLLAPFGAPFCPAA